MAENDTAFKMKIQTIQLAEEWNAEIGAELVSDYALDSSRCTQVAEKFNGLYYSRIHRHVSGKLILEERNKGSMSARSWEITQDKYNAEMERLFNDKIANA